MNALDEAISAMRNGPTGQPELYRQLSEGQLVALLPFHPELMDGEMEMEIGPGSPFPFVVMNDAKKNPFVPVYSSLERFNVGLDRAKLPPRVAVASLVDGKTLMTVVGQAGLRAVVNWFCQSTGHVTVPPEIARGLGDGSALVPTGTKNPETLTMWNVPAAQIPAALAKPILATLKKHRNFKVAWLFTAQKEPLPSGGKDWRLLVVMEPRDDVVYHDLRIVANGARPEGAELRLGLHDEKDRDEIARLLRLSKPFYVAPDYKRPRQRRK